ncbi:MAG: hypothetical protein AB8U16_04080 [Rickettsiales endosymbiont of Dermacentor nuttalli]
MIDKLNEIEKKAKEFGFDWPNVEMIFEQIINEVEEIKGSNSKS